MSNRASGNDSPNEFRYSPVFQKRLSLLLRGDSRSNVEIAKDMGISKDVLIRARNIGEIPSAKILLKAANYLETPVEYLLGLIDREYEIDIVSDFQTRLEELKKRDSKKNGTIASALGFSRSLFNAWKDKNYLPSVETIYMLSRYFKVSMDYLLGRTDAERFGDNIL